MIAKKGPQGADYKVHIKAELKPPGSDFNSPPPPNHRSVDNLKSL